MSDRTETMEGRVINVGSATGVEQLGKSIYSTFTKEGLETFAVNAIGAGAISQAVKGIAVANGMLAQRGKYASVIPGFYTTEIEEQKYSAITLRVYIKPIGA